MDPAIAPLLLVAFAVGMWSTWKELRSSLQPVTCSECPHCRELLVKRQRDADDAARRETELRSWYARRHGADEDDERRS